MVTFGKDLAELNELVTRALSEGKEEKGDKILERFKDYTDWVQSHIDAAREINEGHRLIQESLKNTANGNCSEKIEPLEPVTFSPPKEYSLLEFEE